MDENPRGISAMCEAEEDQKLAFFEPMDQIDVYPAVAYGVLDNRKEGGAMSFWMTPQQIYDELTTGPGSETLQTAQGISYDESAAEQARAARIRKLMTTIESGWQGSAADGAHGAAGPLAAHAAEGAEYLYLAQDLLDRQAGSFHRAAASVEPMPPDPAADLLDQVVPFDVDTDAQTQEYQQKAQHNIRVFEGYDNASNHNETYLPQRFSSSDHSGGGISVAPADTIEVDDTPPVDRYQGPDDGTGPSGYRPATGPSAPAGPVPGGTVPAAGSGVNDGLTGPGSWPGPGGQSGSPGPLGPGLPGGPGPGPGGRGATFGPARGGPGAGSGGSGLRGGAGEAGKPGGPGLMRGPGAAAGALAAEEAAARRAAAAAAGRGGGGLAGAPVGGGRNREEDEEHKRKVLIEADAEGTFGSDVLTAPQVIGDDEYEDD